MPRSAIPPGYGEATEVISNHHDILALPDGAQIAYQVWGTQHIAQEFSIVLIGGIYTVRDDWLTVLPQRDQVSVSVPADLVHRTAVCSSPC